MTVFAKICRLNMSLVPAGRLYAVVATYTVANNAHMPEISRHPADRCHARN